MKLADYLLYGLFQNYQNDDSVTNDTTFNEYLENELDMDLSRYHLDSQEALEKRMIEIEYKHQKAIARLNAHKDKESLQEILKQMLALLGEATKKAKLEPAMHYYDNAFANLNGLCDKEKGKLQITIGRNAIYASLYDDVNNVVSESSFKMSRSSLASRYYERDHFSDWEVHPIDTSNFHAIDPEYEIKQYLTDRLNNKDNVGTMLSYFMLGIAWQAKENDEKQIVKKQANNQDW